MPLAVVMSRALDGLLAPAVHVEVQLAPGLPSFTLVGLAETEVKESRERVRAALQQSGFAFPHNQRITVNLAPAELPKESGRFDLPIALGILAAAGVVDPARLAAFEFAGELSLAGELRPVRGALALALAAQRDPAGLRTLVLPEASARAAAQVPGLDVRAAGSLAQVVAALLPGDAAQPLPAALPLPRAAAPALPDLRDVKGQAGAKRALEIAAAGQHSLLLVGPPGTGKSMLAHRLPGLLPPPDDEQALATAALAGLAAPGAEASAFGLRPLRSPHHTASAVALVGGGSPPRPGEISLAHGGVLFLDETPEFPRAALEALREPLETGRITISRAARQATFPARFQLVAAMNPCDRVALLLPLVPVSLEAKRYREPETLGEHLRAVRRERGLHQHEVGEVLGVSGETVGNWEKDATEPPITLMPAILGFLGLDPFPKPEHLGERLQAYRRRHGLTVRAAADRAKVDEASWSRWEATGKVVQARHRERLHALLEDESGPESLPVGLLGGLRAGTAAPAAGLPQPGGLVDVGHVGPLRVGVDGLPARRAC